MYATNYASSKDWGAFAHSIPLGQESEFSNACTQGGKTKYAYGDQYQPGLCIDSAWVDSGKTAAVTDITNRDCHGTSLPFDGVYDLNGSVAEWQNFCWMQQETCVALGSPYDKANEACTEYLGLTGMRDVARGRGVRCCAVTPPRTACIAG